MLEKRYLIDYVLEDLEEKMVFIGGPRFSTKAFDSIEIISKA